MERTIAVYYSPTYRSAFVLSYKVRSSVSFFHNLRSNIDTASEDLSCALRALSSSRIRNTVENSLIEVYFGPLCQYVFLARIPLCVCSAFLVSLFYDSRVVKLCDTRFEFYATSRLFEIYYFLLGQTERKSASNDFL